MQQAISSISVQRRQEAGFEIAELSLSVRNLPQRLSGYRILQLSDLHWGLYTRKHRLLNALRLSAAEQIDLLFLTGDYVQLISRKFRPFIKPLRIDSTRYHQTKVKAAAQGLAAELSAFAPADGIFGIWGNHDHLEGVGTLRRELPKSIRWLENANAELHFGDFKLQVYGVDDYNRGEPCIKSTFATSRTQSFKSARSIEPAAEQPSSLSILLSHNPDMVQQRTEFPAAVDLMLSGHTHGGQVCLPTRRPLYTSTEQREHVTGLSQAESMHVYVSNGLGQSLLPLRLFCPPELTFLTLEKAN